MEKVSQDLLESIISYIPIDQNTYIWLSVICKKWNFQLFQNKKLYKKCVGSSFKNEEFTINSYSDKLESDRMSYFLPKENMLLSVRDHHIQLERVRKYKRYSQVACVTSIHQYLIREKIIREKYIDSILYLLVEDLQQELKLFVYKNIPSLCEKKEVWFIPQSSTSYFTISKDLLYLFSEQGEIWIYEFGQDHTLHFVSNFFSAYLMNGFCHHVEVDDDYIMFLKMGDYSHLYSQPYKLSRNNCLIDITSEIFELGPLEYGLTLLNYWIDKKYKFLLFIFKHSTYIDVYYSMKIFNYKSTLLWEKKLDVGGIPRFLYHDLHLFYWGKKKNRQETYFSSHKIIVF